MKWIFAFSDKAFFFWLKKLFLFKFNFMKRIIGFLFLIVFVTGCDDGDLSVTTFNFTSQNLSKCADNTFIYNVNQNEVMILDIPLNNFANSQTAEDEPRIYTLNPSDRLVYRLYSGTVNNTVLCSDFPVSEPHVIDEWTALAGATIEITTFANPDENNGGILGISGYTHHIVIKDVIFKKGNSEMIYEEYVFGNYITPNLINFDFSEIVQKCTTNNLMYKLSSREALVMDLNAPNLFVNEETNGTPRTAYINSVTNPIIYKVFNGNITGSYFCSTIPQTSPILVEEWYADDGEDNSGIIEVETEAIYDEITGELVGHSHRITLRDVLFYNNNSAFYFEEYYVGRYSVEL